MLPILLDWHEIIIYSYPLFMGLAWGIGYQLCLYFMQKKQVSHKGFLGLFAGIFFLSWVGAKVFFLIHSSGDEYQRYLEASEFWLGGGFVFYGGLIFGASFALIYMGLLKRFPIEKSYLFLPAVAISHGIGRIGCLLAGCCYGTICHLPWGIHLRNELRHPVQLYESLLLFLLGGILIWLINNEKRPSSIIKTYFIGYAFLRFVLEFFRGDIVRGVYALGLSTSQYVSLSLISGFLIFEIIQWIKTRQKLP